MHDDSVLVMGGRKTGDAHMFGAVIDELLVDLVAHDEHPFLDADIAQGLDSSRV